MAKAISDKSIKEFIGGAASRKSSLLKCLDVLLNREEHVIDEVTSILTSNSIFYEKVDYERCKEDELMILDEFLGHEEEVRYLKYPEFFKLIQSGFEEKKSRFNEADQKEIQEIMDTLQKIYGEGR